MRRAWCLMPLLLLLVVFLIAELVKPASGFFDITYDVRFEWIDRCPEKADPGGPLNLRSAGSSFEAFAQDMGGRLLWAAAAAASFALGIMTLLVSCFFIWRQLDAGGKPTRSQMLIAMGTLGAFGAIVMSTGWGDDVLAWVAVLCLGFALAGHVKQRPLGPRAAALLVLVVIVWVITELPIVDWITGRSNDRNYITFAITMPLFDRLQELLHTTNVGLPWFDRVIGGMSTIVVIALAVAVCALVADCRVDNHRETALRERADNLRLLLYLGGGVLVTGVVFIKLLQDWPLVLVCDPKARTLLAGILDHWPVVVATYWTLMLVAIFVPALISLSRAARQLASTELSKSGGAPSEKAIGEWLDERGLRATPSRQITQFIAILSPWLTSVPVSALFEYVKQAFPG